MSSEVAFEYSRILGKVKDYVLSLTFTAGSDTLPNFGHTDNFVNGEDVCASYSRLVHIAKPYRAELKVLLTRYISVYSPVSFMFAESPPSFTCIDDFIERVKSVSPEEMKFRLLMYYGSDSISAKAFYHELLQNNSLLAGYIQTLDAPDENKYALMRFMNSPQQVLWSLYRYMDSFKAKFESEYARFEEQSALYEERALSMFKNGMDDMIAFHRKIKWCDLSDSMIDRVILSSVVFIPKTYMFIQYYNVAYIHLGTEGHGMDLSPDSHRLEKTDLFTCLNHETKVQIFSVLLSGELCVSELMHKLAKTQGVKIPQATLSGYLTDMCVSEMLTRRFSGTKTYYAIDKAFYSRASEYLEKLNQFMLSGEADVEKTG